VPIVIPQNLPARKTLENENIFVMNQSRAIKQDIKLNAYKNSDRNSIAETVI